MNGFGQRLNTALRRPGGDPLEEFMRLDGRYANFTKETFFLRYSPQAGGRELERLRAWAEEGNGRVFVPQIPALTPAADVERYVAMYQSGRLPFRFENMLWQGVLEEEFANLQARFRSARGRSEEAIVRSFGTKILFWMDTYFPKLFVDTAKMTRFPKFACGGAVKLSEYLFLHLLALLGCDVLWVCPSPEPPVNSPELLALSLAVQGTRGQREEPAPAPGGSGGRVVISRERLKHAGRSTPPPPPRRVTAPPVPRSPAPPPVSRSPAPPRVSVQHPQRLPQGGGRQTLEFEELARFASSVVMLKVFDQDHQCFKSGSGVILNDQGYVLTNLHVVNGGHYYGILLEEETDIFYTNELIKYHQDYDLAILRMERRGTPIPISRGEKKLVRGQKVVAIGSPLGLFNTVSDGIISGFRDMERVSMIQFTAPVSHGSSGGALLDLYGDLIGIITAGYDDGQNLNLAVDCRTILQFAGGFL